MFLIGILLLIGNTSFAQESPNTHSQCQAFVASVFRSYDLPLPETAGFPVLGDFDLENYDQEKPEFTIVTTPIEIQRQQFPKKQFIIQKKNHLQFEGKVLEDGSYTLVVSEIDPEVITREQNPYMQSFYHITKMETPLVHAFHFSKDCEFNSYNVRKPPGLERKGWFVSADSQCEFGEPRKKQGLTAHILLPHVLSYRLLTPSNYMILKYPNYYRGLCALAEKTNI